MKLDRVSVREREKKMYYSFFFLFDHTHTHTLLPTSSFSWDRTEDTVARDVGVPKDFAEH